MRDGAGWNSERYDWIEVIKNMRIDGLYLESIFKIGVFYDIKDNKKVVLYVINSFSCTLHRSVNTLYGGWETEADS